MTRRLSNLSGLAAFLVWACGVAATPALGQQNQAGPEIVNETHHDTSIPVRFLAAEGIRPANRIVAPLHRRPGPPLIGSAAEQSAAEQMIQPFAMSRVATTNLLNFDGVSDRDGDAPPDTNASVGATQVVEVTNTSYEVFNKATGAPILGPAEVSSIWSGFGGTCGNGSNNFSDPVVIYDKAANRWLVTILGSPDGFFSGVECVAVSSTSDATGSYHRYSFGFGTGNLNDYPKFGVWPDAYYASYNMFGPTTFIGAKVCAYNRAHMLAGLSANAHCFQRSTNDFSLLPSDMDGTSLGSVGEPNFFLELFTATTLHLFKFHADFVTPANTTFSGPITVSVNSFTEALWFELRGTGVTATACCPGATATEFAQVAGADKSRLFQMGAMAAPEVAACAYVAMMRGKPVAIPGLRNKLGLQSLRFAPRVLVLHLAAALNRSREAPALPAARVS